jgi:hypothetical protein
MPEKHRANRGKPKNVLRFPTVIIPELPFCKALVRLPPSEPMRSRSMTSLLGTAPNRVWHLAEPSFFAIAMNWRLDGSVDNVEIQNTLETIFDALFSLSIPRFNFFTLLPSLAKVAFWRFRRSSRIYAPRWWALRGGADVESIEQMIMFSVSSRICECNHPLAP